MAELKFLVTLDSSAFHNESQKVIADVKRIADETQREGNRVEREMDKMAGSAGKSIGKIAAYFGGIAALKSFIGKIVEVRAEFQKTDAALQTMLGSKEKADKLLAQVREYAKVSPLEFGDITKVTQQMLAFNIEADKIPRFIRAIGDVSMGEKDRFNSLALAFAQMSASGKLMGQDLLQMINAGFNPLATMAEKTGKSIGQLKDEMSKGAISAEMVQQAFIDATSAGGKFYNMSETASKTVGGQISMMQDALTNALNEIGQANDGIIMNSVQGITSLIENYEQVIRILGALVTSLGIYRGAQALALAVDNARKLALEGLTIQQRILNATMLANPIVQWGAALAAVVTTIYLVATAESAHEKAIRETNEAIEDQEKKLEQRQQDMDSLVRTIRDDTKSEYERIKAYEKLKAIAPELTKEYDRHAIATMDAAKAQKLLNENMDEAEYEEAKRKVDELRQSVEDYEKRLKTASENTGQGAAASANAAADAYQKNKVALEGWEKKLRDIEAIRKQVADESKPIELRIKEADENQKAKKDILDFWDAAAKKIDELSHPSMVMSFEGSKAALDDYIGEMQKTLDNLQKDIDKNPFNTHLQLKYDEGQKILSILQQMRESWIASGNTSLPITLEAQISQSLAGVLNAFNIAKNMFGGLKEEAKKKPAATTPTTKTKKTKKSGGKTTDPKQIAYDVAELRKDLQEEVDELLKDLREELSDGVTAAMKEGRDKEIQAIRDNTKDELRELDERMKELQKKQMETDKEIWLKQNPKKKEYDYKMPAELAIDEFLKKYPTLQAEYAKRRAQIEQAGAKAEAKIREESDKQRSQAMIDYLKEWGDIAQQREAIAKEYGRRIAEAQTEGERLALAAEQRKAERDLLRNKEMTDHSWAFGEVDNHSLEYLERMRRALGRISLDADNYKEVTQQIDSVEAAILDKKNEWRKLMGLNIEALDEQKRLEDEAARAADRVREIEAQRANALERVTNAKSKLKDYLADVDIEVRPEDITTGNAESILGKLDPKSKQYKDLTNLFGDLASSEEHLNEVTGMLGEAQNDAASAADAAGSSIAKTVAIIDKVVHGINENVQSANELFEQMNLGETAFGKGFAAFAESSQYATEAWESLKSGNFMGVVNGVYGSLRTLGNALGFLGIGGMGESDRNLEKDMENLTASNEALQDAIERLSDDLTEGAVADAAETYRNILSMLRDSERNTQEQLQRSGAAYSNGFLGVGGRRSSNARINESITADEWERVSKYAGASVTSAAAFWNLTSKQMSEVAKYAPDVYARIKAYADDGFADASQYMDDYIGYWEQLEEATDAYNEKLTSASFDSIVDDFANALMDMDKSASDFAEDFEEMMRKAVINSLVSNEFAEPLKIWYKHFSEAMEDSSLSDTEQRKLRDEWKGITELGIQRRDALRDTLNWGSTGEGSGAYKAASSFSQEQGDELNGRLTAIQLGQERQTAAIAEAVNQLRSLSVVMTDGGTLGEIRNLMLIGNSHLEDIARYTRITAEYSDRLEEIANKIKTL